jgi:N-acetylmuramoyl-L-alanine amidase
VDNFVDKWITCPKTPHFCREKKNIIMFLVLKKKNILIAGAVFAAAVLLCVIITAAVKPSSAGGRGFPSKGFTVVLDAGHGGVDGGVEGVNTKVKESDLNLAVTKKLERYLKDYGINTVLTRKDKNGLYGISSKGRKQRDMQKRKEIINGANPDLVISIHMNAFPQRSQRGAQVFFDKGNEGGRELAETIQLFFGKNIPYCKRIIMTGDYYILNCTDKPAVIVECGFLSNSADEALLITAEYQEKLAYNIFCATAAFLEG